MLTNFEADKQAAKAAEKLVRDLLSNLTIGYTFEDVSEEREYRYKGDIRATAATGETIYIEVKDDSRIAQTGNILCEEENYIKETDRYIKGNMKSDYDIYAVVSQQNRKVYFFDFKRLQEIYKRGEFKKINHPQQITYCYLLELCRAKQWGALLYTVKY